MDKYLKNNKVLICFNENTWITGDIMLQCAEKIWKIYLEENNEGFASLLFLAHVSMYSKDTIIETNEKYEIIVSFIHKSLTFCLQTLYVIFNRWLKDELRKNIYLFELTK